LAAEQAEEARTRFETCLRHFAKGAAPAYCRAVSELIAEKLESERGLSGRKVYNGASPPGPASLQRDVRWVKTCGRGHWRHCSRLLPGRSASHLCHHTQSVHTQSDLQCHGRIAIALRDAAAYIPIKGPQITRISSLEASKCGLGALPRYGRSACGGSGDA
jgi:hypothetical protein